VDGDGTQIAGPTGVVVAHSSGAFEDFTYNGNFGVGAPHTVAVHFLNDAWGGTATTDRNLYIGGIDFNGQHYAGQNADNNAGNGQTDVDPHAAEMLINGTVTFHDVGASSASDLLV
jgi:hypothetical protein